MLYIFGDNIIFGYRFKYNRVYWDKKEKIINRLLQLPQSILIENEIFNKCKDFIKKLDNKYKLVPYIVKYGRYIKIVTLASFVLNDKIESFKNYLYKRFKVSHDKIFIYKILDEG